MKKIVEEQFRVLDLISKIEKKSFITETVEINKSDLEGLKYNSGCYRGKGLDCNNQDIINKVKKLQQKLINKKLLNISSPTGWFGPKTLRAVDKLKSFDNTSNSGELNKTENTSSYDAILIGGLEHRKGDLKLDQQIELFKKGFGNKNVKGFHHDSSDSEVTEFIRKNPNLPVFMFSAGAKKGIATAENVSNKNKIFFIEPYPYQSLISAVNQGVPAKNVFAGQSQYTGAGIGGHSSSGGSNHWDALRSVGSKFS